MHMRLKEKSFQRNCLKTAKSSSWLSFTLPFGLAERYEWWMMTLLSNNTLFCFWSLLWVHASSSKHELPLTFVTMEEGEKKKEISTYHPTVHLLRCWKDSSPPQKHFYCTFITITLVTFRSLIYGWLSAWNTVCDFLQHGSCYVKPHNGLLRSVPPLYSNG